MDEMLVPPGSDLLTQKYDGPKDSVSAEYGNGYDRCGRLQYSWLNSEWQKLSNEYFTTD